MSLIQDPSSCWEAGKKDALRNDAPMPENALHKSCYMSGWHKGRKELTKEREVEYA